MSNITSSVDNNSKVYYIDKNALPKNFIESGFKLSPNSSSPLAIDIGKGSADIGGYYQELTETGEIDLAPRTANLLYLKKSEYSDCPSIGSIQAKYPVDMIDDNTVGFWDFTNSDTVSSTPNSAVGISSIAVANNIVWTNPTPGTSLKKVDGHCGYAMQGDGATGYGIGANTTGIPTMTQEWIGLFTYVENSATQQIFYVGRTDGYNSLGLQIMPGGQATINYSGAAQATGFIFESAKKYKFTIWSDGSKKGLKINGSAVYEFAETTVVTPQVLYVMGQYNNTFRSKSILDFISLRNLIYSPSQIAQISNNLLLPCTYQTPQSLIPLMTANSSQGCVASANSEYNTSQQAYMAFRNKTIGDGGWESAVGTTGNLQITLPKAFAPDWVEIQAPISAVYLAMMPKDFTIYGSNDNGLTRKTLLTMTGVSGWTASECRRFSILGASTYSTLGIAVNGVNGGSYILINSLDFGTDAVSTTDIRSILPSNSISLGYVKTNSVGVIEIDDSSYKYGRREGATGGNREVFLGWKYVKTGNVGDNVYWDNPFGTTRYRKTLKFALDANGKHEMDAQLSPYTDVGFFETQYPDINKIYIGVPTTRLGFINGVTQIGSGYIGCYAEVLE